MKESKKQVEEAIIIVGESLGMGESTEVLLCNIGIHSTIKELTYKRFVMNKQQYFETDNTVFEAISLIRRYCLEMATNGAVTFEV